MKELPPIFHVLKASVETAAAGEQIRILLKCTVHGGKQFYLELNPALALNVSVGLEKNVAKKINPKLCDLCVSVRKKL